MCLAQTGYLLLADNSEGLDRLAFAALFKALTVIIVTYIGHSFREENTGRREKDAT